MSATRALPLRVVDAGRATTRRYGFRPVRIAATASQTLLERRLRAQLRSAYATRVAEPAARATLRAPAIAIPALADLPEALRPAAERLGAEARAVAEHEVDFLGSGPVRLGAEIDWHQDFKSGYRWPAVFYQDVEITRLHDDSDAKVPWELSRGHQFLTLARAACLRSDERLATELEAQLGAWIAANPPGVGINWVTSMEVALRAVNWIWAIGTVERVRPLDPDVRALVTRSLQAHARHVALHLEGSPLLRGNHYLADVFGLLALAWALPDDPDAPGWRRTGRRAMEREIRRQVLDDGVGFEASLPYHGLALEIFLLGWHIAAADGRPLSRRYRRRLERMLAVSRAVRHPDGRTPVLGDQDSGRVLPAGFARHPSQDDLLDLGAAILGGPRVRDALPHEEVAWTLGAEAWEQLAARPYLPWPATRAFPDGGLYVLDGAGAHMVVRWGGVGQNGNGGHGHNDVSSYELSYGSPVVVDPGSYLYTADVEQRDAFRSARAHNVLCVDGRDMHPLPPGQPFRMPAHARAEVEEWHPQGERIVLTGRHDGYRTEDAPLDVRRRIALDRRTGAVDVYDSAEGSGRHRVESFLHLAAGSEVIRTGPRSVLVHAGDASVRIDFAFDGELEILDGHVSPMYGVRERSTVLRAATTTDLPVTIGHRIAPA